VSGLRHHSRYVERWSALHSIEFAALAVGSILTVVAIFDRGILVSLLGISVLVALPSAAWSWIRRPRKMSRFGTVAIATPMILALALVNDWFLAVGPLCVAMVLRHSVLAIRVDSDAVTVGAAGLPRWIHCGVSLRRQRIPLDVVSCAAILTGRLAVLTRTDLVPPDRRKKMKALGSVTSLAPPAVLFLKTNLPRKAVRFPRIVFDNTTRSYPWVNRSANVYYYDGRWVTDTKRSDELAAVLAEVLGERFLGVLSGSVIDHRLQRDEDSVA
jgi:hypothetical protein